MSGAAELRKAVDVAVATDAAFFAPLTPALILSLLDDRAALVAALRQIEANETPFANATVRRMSAIATAVLDEVGE